MDVKHTGTFSDQPSRAIVRPRDNGLAGFVGFVDPKELGCQLLFFI